MSQAELRCEKAARTALLGLFQYPVAALIETYHAASKLSVARCLFLFASYQAGLCFYSPAAAAATRCELQQVATCDSVDTVAKSRQDERLRQIFAPARERPFECAIFIRLDSRQALWHSPTARDRTRGEWQRAIGFNNFMITDAPARIIMCRLRECRAFANCSTFRSTKL